MNQYIITDYGIIPNKDELQTQAIQKVFDLCRENGGIVVIPEGRYRVGGLRVWSDTTLILKSGAVLMGSDVCEDYEVFDVPDGVSLRTDMELITQYYENRPWPQYRRAILSVYGGKNIKIIGEPGSVIDGDDCTDPHGEEGYRGPHGIFITSADNVTLNGYTIQNCGNFMHQIDNCRNLTIREVSCFGGSDGVHLHCCDNILIEDCVFHTGDDCIAGINMYNITVRRCDLNTSCDVFRAGAVHMLVEDCRMWGPGIYPHRMTVVQNRWTDLVRDKANTLPREAGRHNLICVYTHFASMNFPNPEPFHDIVFRNCRIDNADMFLHYYADFGTLENGTRLTDMTLENVSFTGLKESSDVAASAEEPFRVHLRNVSTAFREGASADGLFNGKDANTIID